MNHDLGRKGEAVAAQYYRQRGYILLGHNYRTRMGELDLIVYKEDVIVFVEVKTRSGKMLAAPAEAVDLHKQRCLQRAAALYLQDSPFADSMMRFDVVEVIPLDRGWQVHCIMDAFQI